MADEIKPTNKILTHFGAEVWSLMVAAGITKQTELIRLLEAHDMKVTHGALSKWMYGESQVNRNFPLALSKALDLSEHEKGRLAYAFAFGQNRPIRRKAA